MTASYSHLSAFAGTGLVGASPMTRAAIQDDMALAGRRVR